ncbi:hypothetical protein AAMO2058_001731700 [Amorphochlora amoebiformis]
MNIVPVEDIPWVHNQREVWHMKEKGVDSDEDCYSRIDASKLFRIRGPNYLEDKMKIPSKKAAFTLVCCKCFETKHKMKNAAQNIPSLAQYLCDNKDQEYFVQTWLVPGHYTVVNLYVRTLGKGEDPAFDMAFSAFQRGDEKYRNDRIKFIAQIIEAPSVIYGTVNGILGGLRPALLGRKLTCYHYNGPNYIEMDVDTGSSIFVATAATLMIKTFARIIANTAFLIEGRNKSELPERILVGHCYERVHINKIKIPFAYKNESDGSKGHTSNSTFFGWAKKRTRSHGESDEELHPSRSPRNRKKR